MKRIRIGLIGYGFMGRAHSYGYRNVGPFSDAKYQPVLRTICGLGEGEARAFADKWGFESHCTDWRRVVEDKEIDVVDICVPNNLHAEIAIAAAQAGKAILCEKPLAMNVAEGRTMVEAVEKANVANMVAFCYRRVPAVTLAKNIVNQGRLGRVYHYRANFLQDWTISVDLPQGGDALWRLEVAVAGSGVTGDLLAHNIDTAIWLNGPITSVSAVTETFVKERKHVVTGRVEPVGIDDACLFMCRFANGSLGLFEATRYARGHKAKYTLEINGEHASIMWDLHDLHRLGYFEYDRPEDSGFAKTESVVRGWRSVHVTDSDMPYMSRWWVPGLQIGYGASFIHQIADFLDGMVKGEPVAPTFRDALETQRVCDAVLESGRTGQWVEVKRT